MTNQPRNLVDAPVFNASLLSRMRAEPLVRTVSSQWADLVRCSDGRPTLIACSGGADSVALTLSIASFALSRRRPPRVALGHVVHDMRPEEEALRDRDRTRALADSLGLDFIERRIETENSENIESSARDRRYAALAGMASSLGMPFVATAHHADDQLETTLMALIRGAGPRGLRGVAPTRELSGDVTLIRPMLDVTRGEIETFLRAFGVGWTEDPTNRDTDRLRAALRHGVIPELLALRPDAARRANRTSALMRDAVRLLDDRVESVFGSALSWERSVLAREPSIVIAEGLRRGALRLTNGRGADALGGSTVDTVVDAIRDGKGGRREYHWTRGVTVRVTRDTVDLSLEQTEGAPRDGR